MQLIFDYSSTSSLGILLESAIASSAPSESAFLLFFFVFFFSILKEQCSLKLVGKKVHVAPTIRGTGRTSTDSSSSDLKQLVTEAYI